VSKNQLQAYLDEFVFRHNRRKTPAAAFQTLLGLGTARSSTEYEQIRGAKDLIHNPLRFAEATRSATRTSDSETCCGMSTQVVNVGATDWPSADPIRRCPSVFRTARFDWSSVCRKLIKSTQSTSASENLARCRLFATYPRLLM
jgi:hypothetical protein